MKADKKTKISILQEFEKHPGSVLWVSDIDADEDGMRYGFGDCNRQQNFTFLKEEGLVQELFESASNDGPGKFGYRVTSKGHDYLKANTRSWWSILSKALGQIIVTILVAVIIALCSALALKTAGLNQ